MQITTYDMWSGDFPVVTARGNVPDVGDISDATTSIASPGLEFAQERYAALQIEMVQNMDVRLTAFEASQQSNDERGNGNGQASTANESEDRSAEVGTQALSSQNTPLNVEEATRVVASEMSANAATTMASQANIPPQFAASLLAG